MADTIVPIVVAIVLVILTCIATYLLFFGSTSKGNTVCLLGLSNSGKTLLYMRVTQGEYVETQTSMKENKTSLKVTNKKNKSVSVEVVDVPGNERLRDRMWKQHIPNILGVTIVIDSVNFPQEKRDVAHLVIGVLSEPMVQKRCIPVLIACNKQDVALATTHKDIQSLLQDEIAQVLSNPSVKLDSIDQSKESKQMKLSLTKDNKFRFADQATPLSIIPCSAKGKGGEGSGTPEIASVKDWLSSLV